MWKLLLFAVLAVSAASSCTESTGHCTVEKDFNNENDLTASFLQLNQKVEELNVSKTKSSSSSAPYLATVLLQAGIVLLIVLLARSSEAPKKTSSDATESPAEEILKLPPPGVDANNDQVISNAETFVDILKQKATGATRNQAFAHVWDMESGLQQTLTYHEFALAVSSGAAAMLASGVQADERVAFLAKGSPHFFVAVLSTQVLGATPVLLNWRQPEQVLLGCITDTKATTLMKGAPYHDTGSKLADEAEILRILAFNDGDVKLTTPLGKQVTLWKWSKDGEMKSLTEAGKRREDEAMIFFTSGSTGQPKPVLHTYSTLLWTSQNFIYPPDAELSLAFLPNFHVIQTVQNFLIPLARGLRVAIHGADETVSISSLMILTACEALKPDVIDTVPFIMAEWSELAAEKLKPLAQCKWVQSGGAPLAISVAERLIKAGVNARTHYGQTEAPGIQLVTIPGARHSELSVFLPPWTCASVSLKDGDNENAEQGELIIRGIGGSSPGYLKDGLLREGSSRADSEGRHSTSDVFCWVTAANGTRGLKHCNRTDDVLLLSTGEMFNPVEMELSVLNYGLKAGLKTARSVVLGHDRPSPFLVIELSKEEMTSAEAAREQLLPGLDEANSAEAEYARIKKGHLLVLSPASGDEPLPTSIKGNVVRKLAEEQFSDKLDEMGKAAEAAALNAVDWNELRKEAEAAGYDDLQKYLLAEGSSRMAELGVDSLGIQSAAGNSEEVQEANRAMDNINAWMTGTVLLVHWYMTLGELAQEGVIPDAQYQIVLKIRALFAVTIGTANGFTATMACFLFAVGWAESNRKIDGKLTFFDERLTVYSIVLFMRKIVIMPLVLYMTQNGCQAANTWFFYSLIMGKATVCMMQYLTMPKPIKVFLASVPLLAVTLLVACVPGLDGGSSEAHNMMLVLPGGSTTSASWLDAIFSPHSFVGLTSVGCARFDSLGCIDVRSIFGGDLIIRSAAMSWSCATDYFVALDYTVLAFIAPFVLGFEYGNSFLAWCKKALPFPGNPGVQIFSSRVLAGALLVLMPFALQWMYIDMGVDLIEAKGVVGGLWQLASTCLVMFLIIAVCNIVPWRAKRMGSSALGLFILPYTWMFINDGWVISAVVALTKYYGRGDTMDVYVIAAQSTLVVGWCYMFGYIFGPLLQQCVLQMINFWRWFPTLFTAPITAASTAADFVKNLPSNFMQGVRQYLLDLAAAFYIQIPTSDQKK